MSASQPGLGPVHIYVCHHAAGIAFEDDVFRPIQVGRALASTLCQCAGMTQVTIFPAKTGNIVS